MPLINLKSFLAEDSGTVTVDWAVLTAGMVGLCLAIVLLVSGGFDDLSGDIATELSEMDPEDRPF